MKLLVGILIGGLLGLAVGSELAARVFFPKFVADTRLAEHSIDSEQRQAAFVSLAALTHLEAGKTNKAKSFLARQVIDYTSLPFDASLPENQRLAPLIEAVRAKSPTLQEELAKKSK